MPNKKKQNSILNTQYKGKVQNADNKTQRVKPRIKKINVKTKKCKRQIENKKVKAEEKLMGLKLSQTKD